MAAPKIVTELAERFDRNKNVYCGSGYNETRLRREFLDPVFEALGWDVDNKRGVSPLYQDVVHEYGTDVEGSQKTADYAFRVGEKVKFFVEAKKPGTRLKDDAGPALQLRRYAYSAGLPLSILTDFEEFAAYDGRVPPKKADAASRARVMYFTYDQYVEAWEEIAAVFSREAVWSGAFDTYAEKTRGGKAEPVDKVFLKMLEVWRDELARNVANRNREKDLDKYELSAAVQAILDRIIFLRAAEDRGIEDRGRLEALQRGEGVYGRLMELCLEADDVYNSGLFHFREEKGRATSRDELTPTLHVDDATLRKIIRELSESPYEFGVVPVEILGQVYEQFLGKTIWLDGQGVHIDYKPEVRKAKGVYYTPQYIVEYIVKNTVGELLKGCKNPRDAAKLKILDPACGSGSFLLGAYQHLINWHLEWYVDDGPAKHEGKVVPTPGPGPVSWRLTATAKKDILVNNLFGVDIDRQAVEVTKLSLLLKTLEGESRESVGAQTKFLRERMLPDLGGNIKWGNSLIGSDYFQGQLRPDEEERRRVNPFDWKDEFPSIIKAGGFDAVIGNPPYLRSKILPEKQRLYFNRIYGSSAGTFDIYILFIEQGMRLIKKGGSLGFINQNKYFYADYGKEIRKLLAEEYNINTIIDFREHQIFRTITTYTAINIFNNTTPKGSLDYYYVLDKKAKEDVITNFLIKDIIDDNIRHIKVDQNELGALPWVFRDKETSGLLKKIREGNSKLIDLCYKIYQGFVLTPTEVFPVFLVEERTNTCLIKPVKEDDSIYEVEKDLLIPVVKSSDILRWIYIPKNYYAIFPYKYIDDYEVELIGFDEMNAKYPGGLQYLKSKKHYLITREKGKWRKSKKWYEYSRRQNFECQKMRKILVPGLARRGRFSLAPEGVFIDQGSYGVILKPEYSKYEVFILGILNSKLTDFCLKSISGTLSGGYYNYQTKYLSSLPIYIPLASNPADIGRHDRLVALVEEMLELHQRLAAAKSDADKKRIQRAVDATDRKIDALVYELYGLSDEEIKIIEGSS